MYQTAQEYNKYKCLNPNCGKDFELPTRRCTIKCPHCNSRKVMSQHGYEKLSSHNNDNPITII
jgi:DNA-directed RNA polymerase subunit RPC12/RpoP